MLNAIVSTDKRRLANDLYGPVMKRISPRRRVDSQTKRWQEIGWPAKHGQWAREV
jgi:hypothetical protein